MKAHSSPVPLAHLAVGDIGRVHDTDLEETTGRFLRAIGLTRTAQFRVCRRGEPCIIQVRSTRVGLARAIADRILVVPVAENPEV
jgi:Fe2+ transport system protein FeoA